MPIPSGYTSGQVVQAVPSLSAYAVTSSTRPSSPFDGQIISETDTDTLQIYKGSAWGSPSGLVLISATTATTVNSFSINNCFSSTYTNYKIVINLSAAVVDGEFTARLRVGGVDATTNYATQRLYGSVSTAGAGQNTAGTDEFWIHAYQAANANQNYIALDICNPAAAAPSTGFSNAGKTDVLNNVFFTHTTSTAYDGITFITSGTNFSGTFRVYGYANS